MRSPQQTKCFGSFLTPGRLKASQTGFGFRKTGIYRARFYFGIGNWPAETISSLDQTRSSRDWPSGGWTLRFGEIFKVTLGFVIAKGPGVRSVVQTNWNKRLWSIGQEIRCSRGKMLYYTADLPFPVRIHTGCFFALKRNETHHPGPWTFTFSVDKLICVTDPSGCRNALFSWFSFWWTSRILVPVVENRSIGAIEPFLWETQSIDQQVESHKHIFRTELFQPFFSIYRKVVCRRRWFIGRSKNLIWLWIKSIHWKLNLPFFCGGLLPPPHG